MVTLMYLQKFKFQMNNKLRVTVAYRLTPYFPPKRNHGLVIRDCCDMDHGLDWSTLAPSTEVLVLEESGCRHRIECISYLMGYGIIRYQSLQVSATCFNPS